MLTLRSRLPYGHELSDARRLLEALRAISLMGVGVDLLRASPPLQVVTIDKAPHARPGQARLLENLDRLAHHQFAGVLGHEILPEADLLAVVVLSRKRGSGFQLCDFCGFPA